MSFTASWDVVPPDVDAGWITVGSASLDTVPDTSHRYHVTVDYGDGRPPYHQDNAMYLGAGPQTWGFNSAYSPGTYTVTVTFTNPTDSSTVSVSHNVVVSPGPHGPPANNAFANATVIPVDLSPAAVNVTHANWNEVTFEAGEPLVDWVDRPFGSCWFTFTVDHNTKLWFNFLNGQSDTDRGSANINYLLWRQEGSGFDGLHLVMIDNIGTGAVEPGDEDPMTYNSDGLLDLNSESWVGIVICAGTYYVELMPQSNGQMDIETHFEPLDGPGQPPRIVTGDQLGYGGTLTPEVNLTAPTHGTVFLAQIGTESWDVGYATVYLAHTDSHGVFFYGFVNSTQAFTSWNELNDTEPNWAHDGLGVAAGPDGTLYAEEYTYHDIGTGSDGFLDHPPNPMPATARSADNDSWGRWRVSGPGAGVIHVKRASLAHGRSGWSMGGFDLTDDDIIDVIYNPARGTFFASTGSSGTDRSRDSLHHQLLELNNNGDVINAYDTGYTYTDGAQLFGGMTFLPDDGDTAYSYRTATSGNDVIAFDLTDLSMTDLGPNPLGFSPPLPVFYEGAWRLAFCQRNQLSGSSVRAFAIYDRSDLTTDLLTITNGTVFAQYPAAPTTWGRQFSCLGTGQQGTRIWFRAFYPLRPPTSYSFTVGRGRSQYATHLVYYDLTDDTWHDAGRFFNAFTDTNGRGGEEIQYYDIYSSDSATLLPVTAAPTPPLPADTLDDNAAMTARVTAQVRLLVSPPGAV